MAILHTGVDLIEIERFENAVHCHGSRFLQRIFTARELAEVGGNIPSLAARFAAKEALAKALGTGIGPISWQEVEVLRNEARQPQLFIHGQAQRLASKLRISSWSLSLSHSRQHAVALVVMLSMNEEGGTNSSE